MLVCSLYRNSSVENYYSGQHLAHNQVKVKFGFHNKNPNTVFSGTCINLCRQSPARITVPSASPAPNGGERFQLIPKSEQL